jgi:hypothetical protein
VTVAYFKALSQRVSRVAESDDWLLSEPLGLGYRQGKDLSLRRHSV